VQTTDLDLIPQVVALALQLCSVLVIYRSTTESLRIPRLHLFPDCFGGAFRPVQLPFCGWECLTFHQFMLMPMGYVWNHLYRNSKWYPRSSCWEWSPSSPIEWSWLQTFPLCSPAGVGELFHARTENCFDHLANAAYKVDLAGGALIVSTQTLKGQESARFDRFIGSCTESRCWHEKVVGSSPKETRLKRLFAGFYFRHVWSSEHVAFKARFGLGFTWDLLGVCYRPDRNGCEVAWRSRPRRTENYMSGTRFDRCPVLFFITVYFLQLLVS
jgi:hypothetical protein